jgi:hypothetical protein
MDPRDNVAVLTTDVNPGDLVEADGVQIQAVEPISRGQKVALTTIAPGETVYRYGEEIGQATETITPGQHVHTHNMGGKK